MANNNQIMTVKSLASAPAMKSKFEQVLGKKAGSFLASVTSSVASNKMLSQADPMTVMGSAMVAATLDLPVVPTLGQAYIVPFKNKGRLEAQFQIGYKGLIQLAQRTGRYKAINAGEIYKDEFDGFDWVSGELKYHPVDGGDRIQHEGDPAYIVGFFAYFELVTGFKKMAFWTIEQVRAHARRYSKSYANGPWQTNFIQMARKTVLKNTLQTWGPLSVELTTAYQYDQAIVKEPDAEPEYADNPDSDGMGAKKFSTSGGGAEGLKQVLAQQEQAKAEPEPAPQQAPEAEDADYDQLTAEGEIPEDN